MTRPDFESCFPLGCPKYNYISASHQAMNRYAYVSFSKLDCPHPPINCFSDANIVGRRKPLGVSPPHSSSSSIVILFTTTTLLLLPLLLLSASTCLLLLLLGGWGGSYLCFCFENCCCLKIARLDRQQISIISCALSARQGFVPFNVRDGS